MLVYNKIMVNFPSETNRKLIPCKTADLRLVKKYFISEKALSCKHAGYWLFNSGIRCEIIFQPSATAFFMSGLTLAKICGGISVIQPLVTVT